MAHFQIPLNLPHAGTIAWRIAVLLKPAIEKETAENKRLVFIVGRLYELLVPYRDAADNPPEPEVGRTKEAAAVLGRELVDEIEKLKLGGDRLGQCVRNLFECLELGGEGAELSLRAGENPKSLQRPV